MTWLSQEPLPGRHEALGLIPSTTQGYVVVISALRRERQEDQNLVILAKK